MANKENPIFNIVDNFQLTEHIPSTSIFKNVLDATPKFTIAIPTYKRTEYLGEAIESALNQDTDVPFEIIIVDNNPERNDETEAFMEKYKTSPNISYYKNNENLGMGGNWNRLFTLSRTAYVIMLHDDDVMSHKYIHYVAKLLEKRNDIMFLMTSQLRCNKITFPDLNPPTRLLEFRLFDLIYDFFPFGSPTGFTINRFKFLELGGFSSKYYPSLDYYFAATILKYSSAHKLCLPLLAYRLEVNTDSKKETQEGHLKCGYELRKALLEEYNVPPFFKRLIINGIMGLKVRAFSRKFNENEDYIFRKYNIKKYSNFSCRLINRLMRNVTNYFMKKRTHNISL